MLEGRKLTARGCRAWIKQARSTLRLAEKKMPGDPNYAKASAALANAERLLAVGALDSAHGQLTEASGILTAVGERAIEAMKQQWAFRQPKPPAEQI